MATYRTADVRRPGRGSDGSTRFRASLTPSLMRLATLLPALATAALLLAVPASSSAASDCAAASLKPSAANAPQVHHATLCLLNEERTSRGLPRLREQGSLTGVARAYARLMVSERFFDHVSPGGSTMAQRIKRTNYLDGTHGWSLGENLAWGSGSLATPAQIVDAWMHSAGHRANILDGSFREIGIGIAIGSPTGGQGATYVNEFGQRG
jgi:uncharacterized protein YkwD